MYVTQGLGVASGGLSEGDVLEVVAAGVGHGLVKGFSGLDVVYGGCYLLDERGESTRKNLGEIVGEGSFHHRT